MWDSGKYSTGEKGNQSHRFMKGFCVQPPIWQLPIGESGDLGSPSCSAADWLRELRPPNSPPHPGLFS